MGISVTGRNSVYRSCPQFAVTFEHPVIPHESGQLSVNNLRFERLSSYIASTKYQKCARPCVLKCIYVQVAKVSQKYEWHSGICTQKQHMYKITSCKSLWAALWTSTNFHGKRNTKIVLFRYLISILLSSSGIWLANTHLASLAVARLSVVSLRGAMRA